MAKPDVDKAFVQFDVTATASVATTASERRHHGLHSHPQTTQMQCLPIRAGRR